MGIEAGGHEGLSREWGLGVSTGTKPSSEGFRATGEITGVILQKPPLLQRKNVGGSHRITAPGKCSFREL